ncbi:MAG: NADH-quinone oxidoreductase subunit NuoF [Phycisphaerales bacterium]|jgi:NADH-quinone oxidoreductase subunit F|nr:NADH-quinone oxidoreductase subunit NuoF [Phycisphaerales bacterium]
MSERFLTRNIPQKREDRKTLSFDEYVATGGYSALKKALLMSPSEVVDIVKAAELRGRGGAGFPCGVKWTFLPEPDGKTRYLCINCDEAEPGTFKDRLLVDFDPHSVIEGIAIACYACQLDCAYFFMRGEWSQQAKIMQNAIDEAYAGGIFGSQGLMGGSCDFAVECTLHRGAGAYICGEETALLEAVEGKRGWPRIKPPFPAVKGLFGRPTIINNVETLAAVGQIVERGADWWQSLGCASSVGGPASYGVKLMGVSGHVNNPDVFEVALGTTLRTLVDTYAGGMKDGRRFKGAIAGGVSMGVLGPDQFDAEMDFDIGVKYDVMGLGTACPTVFDEGTDMVAVARNIARFYKNESCGQCTPCREGADWMYKLLCRIEVGDGSMKDLEQLLEVAASMGIMPGTTICGLSDGNSWAVRTIVNKYRSEFEARCKAHAVPVSTI